MGKKFSKEKNREEGVGKKGVGERVYNYLTMKGTPKPEELLVENLVQRIPELLKTTNRDRVDLMRFYSTIWLTERNSLLDCLEELQKDSVNYAHLIGVFNKLLVVCFSLKMLLLLFVIFFNSTIVSILVVFCLIVDSLVVYAYNDCLKKKEKIKTLVPIFHRDVSNTDMLKAYWRKARGSFNTLQAEIGKFIRAVNCPPGFENEDPHVNRFLANAGTRDPNKREDLNDFFMLDFLALIHSFNSSLKFFNLTGEGEAYQQYHDQCDQMGNEITDFARDLGIYFEDLRFTDIAQTAMGIVSADLEKISDKLKDAIKILEGEKTSSNKSAKMASATLKKVL